MKKIFILLVFTLLACRKPDDPVVLLYFNDAHDISPVTDGFDERGGVARLKTVVDRVNKENAGAIILFGGDLAGGSLFGGLFHGFPLVHAFNHLPVNIASFGQHDFDFGIDNARALVDSSSFVWISSNLIETNGEPFHAVPSVQIEKQNGLTIAFIGLTDAMDTTSPQTEVKQVELIEAVDAVLSRLENVDAIVAMTQTTPTLNKNLLVRFPRINAIFSEERSETETMVTFIGDRPIITPCGNLGSVARLNIWKTKSGIKLTASAIPVDSTVVPDSEFLLFERHYHKVLDKKLSKKVATTSVDFDAGVNTDFRCRWGECALGNLITDAYREHYKADIAVLNGGGIRANIAAGDITLRDIYSVLPFRNRIYHIELSGRDVWDMLEKGVSNVENRGGGFLQISGGGYLYDPKSPIGGRIVEITVAGEKLKLDRRYTVSLPDYILNGGEGYEFDKDAEILSTPASSTTDVDVVIEYIKDVELQIDPGNRIRIVQK